MVKHVIQKAIDLKEAMYLSTSCTNCSYQASVLYHGQIRTEVKFVQQHLAQTSLLS